METRKPQLLFHPVFIFSLVCLLLNDFYWKYEYHNWLTGKLSDITGLFVLSVFLSAFFYRHKSFIYVGVAVFFIWWKTPLSQPAIELFNQTFSFSINRVVDYTDYIAIPFIFAAHLLKTKPINFSLTNRISVYFISAVCLFAFCSTSMIRKFEIYPDMGPRISYNEYYPTRFNHDDILYKLDSMQISYKVDSFTIAPLRFHGGSILIRNRDSIRKNMFVIDPEQYDTAIYVRIDEQPYVAIYDLEVKGEIFPQVNISVRSNDIRLVSIIPDEEQFEEYNSKRSKTKKKFRKLIEEGLIRKLK